MRWLALISLGVLTACATAPEPISLRTPGAQISSAASFDPLRFQGRWYEVAGLQAGDCTIGALTVTVQKGGAVLLTEGPCNASKPRQILGSVSGPGRFTLADGSALWVLWVDESYRTAVIGTPSGAFGYVLNRTRDIPADRMNAARAVLQFNGYDTARLRASKS